MLGVGKLKPAPGTYGSILALIILSIPPAYIVVTNIILCIILVLSYFAIKRVEGEFGFDPDFIVVDEFIAMSFIYSSRLIADDIFISLLALFLFRFFDILKPFPINLLNNRNGSFYVIADDILAAIFTVISIKLIIFIQNLIFIAKI